MELLVMNYLFYLSGLIVFILNRKHFLLMLLSLEFIVLSIFFSFFLLMDCEFYNLFFSLIYLTMSICEGILGLSLMVMMIRVIGNDNILSYSMLW